MNAAWKSKAGLIVLAAAWCVAGRAAAQGTGNEQAQAAMAKAREAWQAAVAESDETLLRQYAPVEWEAARKMAEEAEAAAKAGRSGAWGLGAAARSLRSASALARENAAKAPPVLEALANTKDKFEGTRLLGQLEKLMPGSAKGAQLRAKVEALPGPALQLLLDLGGGVTLQAALIPPGKFLMGSPESETSFLPGFALEDEFPRHQVVMSKPFYMGVYEVTQEQYRQVMGADPSADKKPMHPVDSVTWYEALEFCTRLSAKTSRAVRLPTEAEWEYACRAGSTTRFCFGDDPAGLKRYASFNFTSRHYAVGPPKLPNVYGLYDMHGNVFEWCADWYGKGYYRDSEASDPPGPKSGRARVIRGGLYGADVPAQFCRSAYRSFNHPAYGFIDIGFRVAVEVDRTAEALGERELARARADLEAARAAAGANDAPLTRRAPAPREAALKKAAQAEAKVKTPDAAATAAYHAAADALRDAVETAGRNEKNATRAAELRAELDRTADKFQALRLYAQIAGCTPDDPGLAELRRKVDARPGPPLDLALPLGNNVLLKAVLIPAGQFTMSSPPDEKDRYGYDHPQHEVIISKPFYIGVTKVTQEQYAEVVGADEAERKEENRGPAIPVGSSRESAFKFCEKLTQTSGRKVRLPTEAEWEYACRAGSTTKFYFGDDDWELGDYAWHARNSGLAKHPVGLKKPNAYGLYDLAGNAWERCSDWWHKWDPKKDPKTSIDPQGPANPHDGWSVVRGGNLRTAPYLCRSSYRDFGMSAWYGFYGFRVVIELSAQKN